MEVIENATVRGVTFRNEDVTVDGKRFEGCTFSNSSLIYSGGTLPSFSNCAFNNVTLQFSGAASNTLRYLNGLHQGGFARAVARIFDGIRQGKM
jgi:uncharacterized protein YjbI with pentapeptide repeats